MKSLVLEKKGHLSLRDIEVDEPLAAQDVRVNIKTVGICGSDLHYYTHGGIGQFVVRAPMILGHEAAGVVTEVGSAVGHLRVGDRVCMEPGIPNPNSRSSRLGLYNLDPSVRFWATPPVHGCLRPSVVHPADYTFKLPDNVSFAEGAMIEPLAVGIHAATKARIRPGDVAVVIGAGPIGLLTAMAALAGGCSRVVVSDVQSAKLEIAGRLASVVPVDVSRANLLEVIRSVTDGVGAQIVFECSGNEKVAGRVFELLEPGGTVVFIGMPIAPVSFDIVAAQVKEVRMETVFRYAHVFPRALALLGSGRIDVRPLITNRFPFARSVEAFEFAAQANPSSIKTQIEFDVPSQ